MRDLTMAAKPSTRDRILQASLHLFNTQGERNITTNHIASHLGMSPGNLYYPVLFMRALKVTHFWQLDDPLTVFGLGGTIFGSVFTLSA